MQHCDYDASKVHDWHERSSKNKLDKTLLVGDDVQHYIRSDCDFFFELSKLLNSCAEGVWIWVFTAYCI